jgi:hypothetical protein
MTNTPDDLLGGADPKQLLQIAKAGVLPDNDNDNLPWDCDWIDTFDLWSQTDPAHGVILLIFSPTPGVIGGDHKALRLALFAQNPVTPEPGCYVVGRTGATHGWRLPIPTEFDAACQAVESDPTLKSLPTVVLGRRQRRMYYFPRGIGFEGDAATEIRLDISEHELDWPKLESQLKTFEEKCLNTLQMIPRIWKDQAKWWPIEGAEGVIQGFLEVALRMVFRGFTTTSEVNLPVGRVDLLIWSRDPTAATRALIELKVLRTFSCTGATEYNKTTWQEILNEGRRQTLSYSADAGAALKVLCTYDMRKERTSDVLEEAESSCAATGVTLRTYPVHNSVRAVRKASADCSPK